MELLTFKKYIVKTVVLSLLTIVAGETIYRLFFEDYYLWYFPFIPLFFLAISLTNHWILLRAHTRGIAKFNAMFTLTTGIKLLLLLGMIAIFAISMKKEVIQFVIPFIATYAIFTVFNTKTLMKELHFNKIIK